MNDQFLAVIFASLGHTNQIPNLTTKNVVGLWDDLQKERPQISRDRRYREDNRQKRLDDIDNTLNALVPEIVERLRASLSTGR